jgi:hypothetical protein
MYMSLFLSLQVSIQQKFLPFSLFNALNGNTGTSFHLYFAQYKQCLTLVKKVGTVPVYTADTGTG